MKTFKAELHIHTVLSPCASIEMIPPIIIKEALRKKINLIAITDHNHTANIRAVQNAAKNLGIHVLPGIEVQTREDIHSVCLFDEIEQIEVFQEIISANMKKIKNKAEFFGEQYVVDEIGDFIRKEEQLLIMSCDLSLKQTWNIVNDLEGLLIPAHIDRKKFGLLPVLGLVPQDIELTFLEVSKNSSIMKLKEEYSRLERYCFIQSGDAHYPEEILGRNVFKLEAPTIEEIKMAASDKNGRMLKVIS